MRFVSPGLGQYWDSAIEPQRGRQVADVLLDDLEAVARRWQDDRVARERQEVQAVSLDPGGGAGQVAVAFDVGPQLSGFVVVPGGIRPSAGCGSCYCSYPRAVPPTGGLSLNSWSASAPSTRSTGQRPSSAIGLRRTQNIGFAGERDDAHTQMSAPYPT